VPRRRSRRVGHVDAGREVLFGVDRERHRVTEDPSPGRDGDGRVTAKRDRLERPCLDRGPTVPHPDRDFVDFERLRTERVGETESNAATTDAGARHQAERLVLEALL
jgi:hypothetical protein